MTPNSTIIPPARPAKWHQRWFAGAMAQGRQERHQQYHTYKQQLLGTLQGKVLEIGPGAGPNLAYYPSAVEWEGIEPNPAMYPYLVAEAERLGMTITLRDGNAEQLDAPDHHYDAVVCTLVLCSVPNPQRALQEIRRVLKPGGRFIFIEHVAAPPHTFNRRLQQWVTPLWKPLADGCHPNRDTGAMIQQAGFERVHLDNVQMRFPIVGPHIVGYAVNGG